LDVISNPAAPTPFAAHKVGRIKGQAVNEQQISLRAFLPESTIQSRGNFDGLPRGGPLATVVRNLGSHLRVVALCRSDIGNSLEGRRKF
jgi:hypothetical protein